MEGGQGYCWETSRYMYSMRKFPSKMYGIWVTLPKDQSGWVSYQREINREDLTITSKPMGMWDI